ncbi:MAG: TetR/AcrR family transcriptional regulator [Bacteroidetes bacterium]|nr:TetR/AcrR family transcriptional regulator [Bacteroidota bacterium]
MEVKLKKIIDGAVRLFKKYGIRSVSMDDICQELGMSKKTLYQFVRNKPDLIDKVLENQTSLIFAIIDEILTSKLNAIDVLLEASKQIGSQLKDANPVTEFDLNKYYPELYRIYLEKRNRRIFNYLKENIGQGIREGLYRADLDVDLTASLYIKKMEGISDPDFCQMTGHSYAKIFQVMFDNHIRGISNDNGIYYYEKQLQNSNF